MDFMFTSLFWGALILITGLLIIVKSIFNLDLPVFKIIFGLFLILLGLSVFMGTSFRGGVKNENSVVFSEGNFTADGQQTEYSVVFGKGNFDLRKLPAPTKNTDIKVSSVFGSGTVRIKADTPMKIKGSSAFGSVKLPNGATASFGEQTYVNKGFKEDAPYYNIQASSVFGSLEIIEE